MEYRRQIDGLRAVAILPVVLFHVGFPLTPGGYTGVDIFFVISGFLITALILEDLGRSRFSVLGFYERRARRILPALFFMMAGSGLISLLLLSPSQFVDFARSALSVIGFVSNIFFYLDIGYFSTVAEEKPLLHTWSLAIEEQYYIFFPLLCALLYRARHRFITMIVVLGLLWVGSLLLAQWMSWRHSAAAFYLIPTRTWELLTGSLIAISGAANGRWPRPVSEIGSMLGLMAVLASFVLFDKSTPFPSFHALLPVMGAGALIVFSRENTLTGRLLSHRIFVGIGLISYSLYLWHQPILAFLRVKSISAPSVYALSGAVVLAVMLAIFSWAVVERPFRDRRRWSSQGIFRWSAVGTVLLAALAGVVWHGNGWPARFGDADYEASILSSPDRERCHTKGEEHLPPAQSCVLGPKEGHWAVFGDSHGVELSKTLSLALASAGEGVRTLTFSACPPALKFVASTPGCSRWTREAIQFLERAPAITDVLVVYRHSAYLYAKPLSAAFPAVPSDGPGYGVESCGAGTDAEHRRECYWDSFEAIVQRLTSAGKRVHVLDPIPELRTDIRKLVVPLSVFSAAPEANLDHRLPRTYYEARNRFVLQRMERLRGDPRVLRVRPQNIFCDDRWCDFKRQGASLYFDDNHPSLAGSALIADEVLRAGGARN